MTYNEFKKQAGFGTNIAIGAGIGAVGGGLASLLPTSADKKKRLRRAIMLIGSGAIIGGSTGAAISKLMPINNNAEYTSKQKRKGIDLYKQRDNGFPVDYRLNTANQLTNSMPRDFYLDR